MNINENKLNPAFFENAKINKNNSFTKNLQQTNDISQLLKSEEKPKANEAEDAEILNTLSDVKEEENNKEDNGVKRTVTVSSKPTDEQQEVLDNIVDEYINKYTDGDNKIVDDVTYQDENGNIQKREVKSENGNGDDITTTIEYDENGRVSYIHTQQNHEDGKSVSFEYNEDGTITVQSEYRWIDRKGNDVYVPMGIPKHTIDQNGFIDGKMDGHSELVLGLI